MKVSGFTFVRNAIQYDYPVKESILSLMPLCDEIIVAVGKSDDGTETYISDLQSKNPIIKILPTIWDESLRTGGRVLASETDKAFGAISTDANWAIYLQGDEVLHSDDYLNIRSEMEKHLKNPDVEGLLFKYKHFYGSYNYTGTSRKWYRREIRIIRNNPHIFSYRDAQGFRIRTNKDPQMNGNRKLNVKLIDATIYHYGWVKRPDIQKTKFNDFQKLWHEGENLKQRQLEKDFDYHQIRGLEKFTGTHPPTMIPRIESMDWEFNPDSVKKSLNFKDNLLYLFEKFTGKRIGEYRNYNLC